MGMFISETHHFAYDVRERNCDDGDSVLIDNFIVVRNRDEAVMFEGTQAECAAWVQTP